MMTSPTNGIRHRVGVGLPRSFPPRSLSRDLIWYPTVLPFKPTSDFYSDEEIEQLEFPMIIKQAKERKEQIAELSLKEVRLLFVHSLVKHRRTKLFATATMRFLHLIGPVMCVLPETPPVPLRHAAPSHPSPLLAVLHLVGSAETPFLFDVSFLYAKQSCRFEEENAKNYYAILLPNGGGAMAAGRVALLEDEIPRDLTAGDLMDDLETTTSKGETDIRVASVAEFLGLVGRGASHRDCYFRHPLQLVVPYMFDDAGMTSWRMLVEDVLKLPLAGMSGRANVFAQDKVATRTLIPSLMPRGFSVSSWDLPLGATGEGWDVSTLMERIRAEAGGFPVMLKSPLEDNSRGLHLVGKASASRESEESLAEELREKLADAFGYGDRALFEQFVPGREFRCGVIERRGGVALDDYRPGAPRTAFPRPEDSRLDPIPVMLEYVMTDPHMPIRTTADKYEKKENSQMSMTKCVRRYVSRRSEEYAGNATDFAVHPVDAALQREMEGMAMRAHEALGCGAYSLFDFRVDFRDPSRPRPYIIECCPFWSFAPMSAITLLLRASDLDWERILLDLWRARALTAEAAKALVEA